MLIIEILIYFAIFIGLYFTIFLFSIYLDNQKKIYKGVKKKNFPLVCLIVPCWNEAKNIEKTLHSLLNLNYPKNKLEIIVVDDGSIDETFQKVKDFQKSATSDSDIKIFKQKHEGKYAALNLGLKNTKAKFVGSVDADSYLDINALKKVMKHFESPKISAVASTIKLSETKNILGGILYVEYLMAAFWRKIFSFLNGLYITPGAFSVYRRKILGSYRDPYHLMAEDLEVAFRLQRKNFKIAYAIDAFVYTKSPTTFKSLFKQRLRWYKGFLLTLKDYFDLLNIKKHGNLSFLLYFALVSVFVLIILVSYNLWKIIEYGLTRINQLVLTGFDFSNFFSFDWRLINFNFSPIFILGNLCLIVFLFYLHLSKKLTFDKKPLKKNALSFILFYTHLSALWWLAAIFSVLKRQTLCLIKKKN
jgi:cellulose synthase/poly-beta-1,6-N-acetylglucosamine synthase-like glycosyltransferase